MLGVKSGDTVKAKLTFPKNYHSADLAGKKAEFEITVKNLEKPILPELNSEFYKKCGIESGSEKDFSEQIKTALDMELNKLLNSEKENNVFDALQKSYKKILVPNVLIDEELKAFAANANQEEKEKISSLNHTSKSPLVDTARGKVLLSLVCQFYIRELKLTLDKARLESYVKSITAPYMMGGDVMKWFYEDKDRVERIQGMVIQSQLVDILADKMKVKQSVQSFKDFRKKLQS